MSVAVFSFISVLVGVSSGAADGVSFGASVSSAAAAAGVKLDSVGNVLSGMGCTGGCGR